MRTILLTATALLFAGAAQAQTPHPLAEGGRYQLMEVNDKIVRLDTETGGFELCAMQGGNWRCKVAEDERQELNSKIDALSARVSALEEAQAAAGAERARLEAEAREQEGKGLLSRAYDYVPSVKW